MSERKINLEEISNLIIATGALINSNYKRSILEAMKEACRQTLKLAAENAKMTLLIDEENDIVEEANIDKQSILNTINQIE